MQVPKGPSNVAHKTDYRRDKQLFDLMHSSSDRLEKLETKPYTCTRQARQGTKDNRVCHRFSGEGHLKNSCNWQGEGAKNFWPPFKFCRHNDILHPNSCN